MFKFLKKIGIFEWNRLCNSVQVVLFNGHIIDYESGNLIAFDYWYDNLYHDYFKLDIPNSYFNNGDD